MGRRREGTGGAQKKVLPSSPLGVAHHRERLTAGPRYYKRAHRHVNIYCWNFLLPALPKQGAEERGGRGERQAVCPSTPLLLCPPAKERPLPAAATMPSGTGAGRPARPTTPPRPARPSRRITRVPVR